MVKETEEYAEQNAEQNTETATNRDRKRKITVLIIVGLLAAMMIAGGIFVLARVTKDRGGEYSQNDNETYRTEVADRTVKPDDSDVVPTDDDGKNSTGNSEAVPTDDDGKNSADNSEDTPSVTAGDRHTDADNNGKCDLCGAKMTVEVDLYAINDLHGKFDDSYGQPGVDELTTYLRERTVTDEHAVFLSSGDMWQGSAESNQTEGGVVIDWMNEMDFVSMTLGNHEFDWGEDIIAQNSQKAEFPFLAINVYSVETLEQVPYCKSSVLVDAGDVKIGIIGAIGDCYSSIAADQSQGFYIITGDELTQLVREEALKLRAEGADLIVYSIHDGYSDSFYADGSDFNNRAKVMADSRLASYYDVALSDEYVDIVFEGHTHQNYVIMDTKRVYHLQDGGENEGISHAQFVFSHQGEDAQAQSGYYTHECTVTEIVSSGYYSRRGRDSLRDEILEKYADKLAFTKETLGYNPEYLGRDELRRILAELYYETGCERWGNEYDIALGGGFMSVRDPRHLDAGDVTYADLQALFPFDNELVLCSCSGYDLRRVFLETSNSNYFIYSEKYGTSTGSKDIDLTGTYYVVTDTYSSTYEPNNLTEIERYGADLYARDLLAEMFREGSRFGND